MKYIFPALFYATAFEYPCVMRHKHIISIIISDDLRGSAGYNGKRV